MRFFIVNCVLATYVLEAEGLSIRALHSVDRPNTLYMDGEDMLFLRANQDEIADAVTDIIERAETYMEMDLLTVLDKGKAPPFDGAEINDYFSFSPYYWLANEAPCLDEDLCVNESNTADDMARHELLTDSDFKDTLTNKQYERLYKDFAPAAEKKCYEADVYVKCDGDVNPHADLKHDKDARNRMLSAIYSGSMAFWYSGEEKYAEMASKWLQAWFVNKDTRMNPHMNFAQGIPGTDISGQKYGLIEMQRFPLDVFECAEVLKAGHSKHWSDSDHDKLQQWQGDFLKWMKNSEMANEAGDTYNNHATWEAFLRFYLSARTLQPDDVWEAMGDITTNVMDTQFSYDAILPYETFRPLSRHYYSYGLLPLVRAASILKQFYNRFGEGYTNPDYFGNYLFTYTNLGTHVSLLEGMSKIHSYATEAEVYPFPDTETDWLKLESGSIFDYEEIVVIGTKYAPSTPTDTYLEDLKMISGYDKSQSRKSALRLMFSDNESTK
ncbi:hypothetical protein SARC_09784 [Sphaeroforma arctica JP610]|uniref:Alginate lyase domain-containing protein n=1 Tax=Sphaeroforma arctica JP610 TaxID=667725 RepID=A0A0L0FP55_9EUKA|nr:hypothetical protein SARC_09784 [Sphaeroforma arctica JP610]KNC77763.1 hypothetical protein SARC_09784 [Sphaeroforma arctica JP610]|eukprot:XP_014151665.1 hypothetical protein SARC_09784 [Sphaeroforma arctica JP610]